MFTRFEEFAATQMLGQPDSPPRCQGKLFFAHEWQRKLFGIALSLAKEGHFEWEDFRQQLIRSIGEWDHLACGVQPPWDYYERFLEALAWALEFKQLATSHELAQAMSTHSTTTERSQGSNT